MRFFLGTHQPAWLGTANVPLFVSYRRLANRRTLPRALAPWALDSGGFTELSMHGTWRTPASTYLAAVRRFRDEIGNLAWAAPMDWMCEPWITGITGLSVAEHQRRTINNLLHLRDSAPDLPIIPVLQGWELSDYLACADAYEKAGIDLRAEPVVGLGSVCRRQSTAQAATIVTTLAARGLKLHGFGFKTLGLRSCGHDLTSADSLAWSYDARRKPPLPGHSHKNCANCLPYALDWRTRTLNTLPPWHQPPLGDAPPAKPPERGTPPMFEIRVICDDADADRIHAALTTAFQTTGPGGRTRTHDGQRVRLYLDADHLPSPRPTPEAAYATAPSVISEIGWTCERARSYVHSAEVDREFWLRKAALLDRIALTDDYSDAAEMAVQAARRLRAIDAEYEGVPGDPDRESAENLRGYVRQEYAHWLRTDPAARITTGHHR